MITYRPHKGSLSDSMKDKKKFNTLQDLLEYIVKDHNTEIPYFQICIDDLSIKMYGYGDGGDKRVGWKDLFVICYESYDRIADKIGYDRYFGGEQYDHPCGVIGFFTTAQPELVKESGDLVNDLVKDDTISRQAAINTIRASTSKYKGFMEMEMYTDDDAVEAIEGLPSIQLSRIERELHGKTPEEQYKILYQLMFEYANTFNDARRAVIDWLGE